MTECLYTIYVIQVLDRVDNPEDVNVTLFTLSSACTGKYTIHIQVNLAMSNSVVQNKSQCISIDLTPFFSKCFVHCLKT
jgi:surface polysaccharide O-acyltransferase-like enzyme